MLTRDAVLMRQAAPALAPDPGVPQRDSLLDDAIVARLLGGPVERVYAKYRVGESLRVVHRLGGGGHVAARTFRDGASAAAYERALGSAVPAGGLPPVLHAPELDAVFWTFPNDRRIVDLPLLAPGSPALADLLGRRCAETRLMSYAAERAASAACLDDRGGVLAYVKVHAGDGAERERRALAALGPTGPRVPRVLGRVGARARARAAARPAPRGSDRQRPGDRAARRRRARSPRCTSRRRTTIRASPGSTPTGSPARSRRSRERGPTPAARPRCCSRRCSTAATTAAGRLPPRRREPAQRASSTATAWR